jgi:transposase InsO family protein
VHVAIDDATRLAYVEVLCDEKATTAIAFLRRALAHFASYGITVERLMTDNGSAYRSAIRALAIRHIRTRPYRPQTKSVGETLRSIVSTRGPVVCRRRVVAPSVGRPWHLATPVPPGEFVSSASVRRNSYRL